MMLYMCSLEATLPMIWQSPRRDFEVVPGLFHSGVRVGVGVGAQLACISQSTR